MSDTNEPAPNNQPNPKTVPETFSREYVSELRHENASYRTKAQEAAAKLAEAEAKVANAAKESDEKVSAAQKAANDRIIRAELKAAAVKAGMVDLDGLKLADLSKVKLNDAGEIEGADALMEEMKKTKSYLFSSTTSTSNTDPKPKPSDNKPKKVSEMTEAERKAEEKRLGFI